MCVQYVCVCMHCAYNVLNFFKKIYLFTLEREREREHGGTEGERERERASQAAEPSPGL